MNLMEQISKYLGDYYRQHHSTLTTREIASACGLSPAAAYKYLVEMDIGNSELLYSYSISV